jgi:hypothetical protein
MAILIYAHDYIRMERISKSKKDIQNNDNKKFKRTSNDLKYIHIKLKLK